MRSAIRRPIISAQVLAQLGQERGIDIDALLENTRIDRASLMNPQTEITDAQELQLIRNLLARAGSIPGLGLDAGLRYRLSSFGIWGYALLSSPSLRSAAQMAVRYLELSHAFCRVRLETRGSDLLILFDDGALPVDVRQFLVERDFAAWANAAWELRPGGFPARSAHFRFPRPGYATRFDKLCGIGPVYDAPFTGILLDARHLDAPLPQADPAMARLCDDRCRQLLARRRVDAGFADQVRNRLLKDPAVMPSAERMAQELNLGERSLRRYLSREGTSFRRLVEDVRKNVAEELLLCTPMKITEITLRLGYSDPTVFIAAFKRWCGVSPSAYRAFGGGRFGRGSGPLPGNAEP